MSTSSMLLPISLLFIIQSSWFHFQSVLRLKERFGFVITNVNCKTEQNMLVFAAEEAM